MNRSQLMKRINQAWDSLLLSYSNLTNSQMIIAGVTGQWSIKDIIGHVTTWEEEALTYLPIILNRAKLPRYSDLYGGIDAFNLLMTTRKTNLTLKTIMQQRDQTHLQLIEFINSVPEIQFVRENLFRKRLRLDTYAHYKEHAKMIRRWRNGPGTE